jgi:2-C-methyl-D-erythritol 4-phosphate cytidylyltransferase
MRMTAQTSSPTKPDVAVVLLAGGTGSRMKADRPKQFLMLAGCTVLEHSLAVFCSLPEVSVLVLVMDPAYRASFAPLAARTAARHVSPPEIVYADPGVERQDSVLSGLCVAEEEAAQRGFAVELVAVHDSARPLVTQGEVKAVIRDAREHGAAVLGVPCKATVKESEDGEFVLRTVPRERLWEVQTPQVVRPALLRRGFEFVQKEGLAVTDDVSVVEWLNEPVKLTAGDYTNLKITTPEDLDIATSILNQRSSAEAAAAVRA